LIYKQVSWFDRKEKAPGILTNILSEDINSLNGLTTETLATIIESFIALFAGIVLSAFFQWRMAIICILACPFVMLGGIVMARLGWKSGPGGKNKDDPNNKALDPYEESNALLSDVILNYRTVISFGQENINIIMDKYESLLTGPATVRVKNAHIAGVAYGYSLCIRLIYIGVVFYVGSKFIVTYNLDPQDVFQSIYIIFTAALGAGFAMSSVPSATKAKESAQKIFTILDEPSTLDVREQKGKLTKFKEGAIELKNLSFKYPSRKAKVLDHFNLSIPAGKKIGLVGHSGCGKSTITNLLLRFYNLQEGQILIDGKSIDEYDILEMRRQIGYVMQEPVLFNMSIKDNILYGQPDASDAKVHQIAEMANALTFIESNFEELSPEEQLDVVHKEIRTAADKL
jgi:ATP-binding cassette subfamily B (MDR/TAP) protein 1